MKFIPISIFLVFVLFNTSISLGQNEMYSNIFKNVNQKAASLYHDINDTGDTLILKSQHRLNKIEIIGDFGVKMIEVTDNVKEAKLPLNTLGVGDYTISVYHTEGFDDTYIYRKTIVFKIARLLPIVNLNSNGLIVSNEPYLIKVKGSINNLIRNNNESIVDNRNPQNNEIHGVKTESINLESHSQKINRTSISLNKKLPSKSHNTENNDLIFVPYSLSDLRRLSQDPRYVIQTRKEYRSVNFRPNGNPYD